jgi:hypothetical protein
MGRLIDADVLKKDLTRFYDGEVVARKLIDEQPTVDAVPVRHGRWIDIDSEMYTWKIRCSKCGHERSMMSTGQIYPMYCEDCGARMDGKDGEQNG